MVCGASEHLPDGPREDYEIPACRARPQVLGVEFELARQNTLTIGAINVSLFNAIPSLLARHGQRLPGEECLLVAKGERGGSSDAWLRGEHQPVERVLPVNVAWIFWSGTDQKHVTAHDVPQLRQLVELRSTQQAPHGGNPRIAGRRDSRALRAYTHRPQLDELERSTGADTDGAVHDRARRRQANCQRERRKEWRQHNQQDEGGSPLQRLRHLRFRARHADTGKRPATVAQHPEGATSVEDRPEPVWHATHGSDQKRGIGRVGEISTDGAHRLARREMLGEPLYRALQAPPVG